MATEIPLGAGALATPDCPLSGSTSEGDATPSLITRPQQRAPTNNTLLRQSLGLTVSIPRVPQFSPVVDLGDAPTYYAACPENTRKPITSFHPVDLTGYPGSRIHAEVRRHYNIVLLESSGDFGRTDYLQWHQHEVCPCLSEEDEDDEVETDSDNPWTDSLSRPTSSRDHEVGPAGRSMGRSDSLDLVELFSPQDEVSSETASAQRSGPGTSWQDARLQVQHEEPGPQSPWVMGRRPHPNLCRGCLETYVSGSRFWSPLSALCCRDNSDTEGGQAVSGPHGHAHSYTGDDSLPCRRCATCNSSLAASSRLAWHSGTAESTSVLAAVTGWVRMARQYLAI